MIDFSLPPALAALQARVRRFIDEQVDVLPDAGHFVHLECPERAAAEITAFFRRLAAV